MKLHIEIDCTPDEAREFLGLPNVKPMQEALLKEIERRTAEALSQSPEAMLNAWLPPPAAGAVEQWQKALFGLLARPAAAPRKKTGE